MDEGSFLVFTPVTDSRTIVFYVENTKEVVSLGDSGFVYRGVRVEDGGKARAAFLRVTGGMEVRTEPITTEGVFVDTPEPNKAEVAFTCSMEPNTIEFNTPTIKGLLRLDSSGVIYKGTLIEDAHEAYAAFMATMEALHKYSKKESIE